MNLINTYFYLFMLSSLYAYQLPFWTLINEIILAFLYF